jgi:aminoglycoside 6'-N-acetyltransferase I
MPKMGRRIVTLNETDLEHIETIASFLFDCFRKYSPEWVPNHDACLQEVRDSFEPGKRSRVCLDENDCAVGWIGAIEDEDVWEIHPIAVAPNSQRNGLGYRLVEDICTMARESGAVAVCAGTSDEVNATSFSQVDLYNGVSDALKDFTVPPDHAINFWLRAGFSIVGVEPDGEGLGKPSIHFSKRIV